MELQKVFKSGYINKLSDSITTEKYLGDKFIFDPNETNALYGIYNNAPDLALKMDPDKRKDFESAIALYEAYKDLTPLVASGKGLWVYLAHAELFDYVKKRWDINAESTPRVIKDHWFETTLAGTLSGLWWAVYFTVQPEKGPEHQYDLTKILFENQTFRTRTFFTYKIARHEAALIGVLEFMQEHWDVFKNQLEAKADYVTTYFSRLGTTKHLLYMDKEFFKSELEKKMPAIRLATDTANVRHNREIWTI